MSATRNNYDEQSFLDFVYKNCPKHLRPAVDEPSLFDKMKDEEQDDDPYDIFKPEFYGGIVCDAGAVGRLCENIPYYLEENNDVDFEEDVVEDFIEDYEEEIPSSELHPASRDCLLVGGGKNRKRNNRRRKRRVNNKVESLSVQKAEASMGTKVILGASKETDLQYVDADSFRKDGGNTYLAYDFKINDVYDPDPLFLTGGVTGFNEMCAFFLRFRVDAVEIHAQFSNQETFAVTVGIIFSPERLATSIGSRSLAIDALERYGAEPPMIMGPASGNGLAKFPIMRVKPSRVLGNPAAYYGSENYCGFFNASPVAPIWMTIIAVGPNNTGLANGIGSNVRLRFKTHFYSIRSSLLGNAMRIVLLEEYQKVYKDPDILPKDKIKMLQAIEKKMNTPEDSLAVTFKST